LYQTLWGLQQNFFQKSPSELSSTIANEKWSDFTKQMEIILSALSNTIDLDIITIQQPNISSTSTSSQSKIKPYFTKFLTSSSLMNLELKDPYFRRHLLIQMQIFIQSMLNPFGPFHPQLDHTRQKGQLNTFLGKIKDLLEKSGSGFAKCVEVSLERDNNWVSWKGKGCQPIEKKLEDTAPLVKRKSAVSLESLEKTGEKGDSLEKSSEKIDNLEPGEKADGLEAAVEKQTEKKRVKMGNANLDRLWNLHVNLETFTSDKKRAYEPQLSEFLKPLEEQVKKEEQSKEKGKERDENANNPNTTTHHNNHTTTSNDLANGLNPNDHSKLQNDEVYAFRAVRLIARQKFDLLGRMTGGVAFNLDSAIKLSKLNDIPVEATNQNENEKLDVVMESVTTQQREELEDGETHETPK